jgi:hypothetical protein
MLVRAGRWVVVTFVALAVIGYLPALADAETTSATIYQAFTPHGFVKLHTRSKAGYCWVGALSTSRRDAWRCFVGNNIYDPCFSSARYPGFVLCPDEPWRSTGIKLLLTKPLPRSLANHDAPSLSPEPWALELYDGRRCRVSTGATSVVEGERLNYFCGGGSEEGLWGFPARRSQPWTILTAPFEATELTERVAVRHAWT